MVATLPPTGWLEVHPENFLANPHAAELLTELCSHYPISFHTVGISVGSVSGIDRSHMKRLQSLIDRIHPILVSGHLAWSTYGNDYLSSIDAEALPDTLLELQPGLHYLSASWPVDELMKLYLSESVPDRFELSPAEVRIEIRGARGEFHLCRLDPAEATFRKAISEGYSIGDAADAALEVSAGFDPGKALATLIAAGLIKAIRRRSG